MDKEPEVSGRLEIFDGRDPSYPRLITYDIINGTLPMGVTSTFHYMFVKFSWNIPPRQHCPSLRDCIKFTILVDSAPGNVLQHCAEFCERYVLLGGCLVVCYSL